MNKVFKVIWNHATQSWVAVSELTSARGKTKSKTSKLTALSLAVGSAVIGGNALAAVYVNNEAASTAGDGNRLAITTGQANRVASAVASTNAATNFIRIGDANAPFIRDGQIIIGYQVNNSAYGEAGDVSIGNYAKLGGGGSDSFSTLVGFRTQSAGPSVAIGVGARSDIHNYSGWNGTTQGGVAIGAFALQGGNVDAGVSIGALSASSYTNAVAVGALSGAANQFVDLADDVGYSISEGGSGATSIGHSAGARGTNSTAIGYCATTAQSDSAGAVAVGYNANSIGAGSIAMGQGAVAGGFTTAQVTALTTKRTNLQTVLANIETNLTVAIAANATKSTADTKFHIANLQAAKARTELAISRINADINRTSAESTVSTTTAMAIGFGAKATNLNTTAIGRGASSYAQSSISLGRGSGVTGVNATRGMALGDGAAVTGDSAVNSTAIGAGANIRQNSTNAIAFGTNASVVGDAVGSSNSIAIGNQTAAGNRNARWDERSGRALTFLAAQNATAVGSESIAGGNNSAAFGYKNVINAPNSTTVGFNNTVGSYSGHVVTANVASANYIGLNTHVIGANNNVTANNTMVFGNNIRVTESNRSGGVVIGDNSSLPTNTTAVNSASVNNITYSGFAGNLGGKSTDGTSELASDQGRFVSIGNSTSPRQLKHVAAGRIANDSTDAINGSQLYSLTGVVSNMGVSVANVIGGNAVLNPNGTVSSFSQPLTTTGLGDTEAYTAPTTSATNVSTAITNLNNYVNAGWKIAEGNDIAAKARISPDEQVNFKAGNLASVTVATNATNKGADVTYSVKKGTFDTTTNGTVKANSTEGVVTNTDVATAVNNSGWNTTLSTGKTLNVNPGDQVNYVNGNGTTANVTTTTVNGKDVVSVSYDVNTTTGTIETNGTVSVADNNAFLNASSVANLVNNAAFNVTTAKVDAFVTNQEGKANATVKAGGNITYTAGKNIAIKQDGTNFTFATEQNVTFTNANVTSTLALGNGTAGSSSPVVNLKTENATAANVNNEAPTSALNITSADGKPTQIKGVGSSLNTSTVNVTPITDAARTTEQLLDLGNTTNPLSKDVLNSAATVRDLTNLGWVVSANGNSYKDTVTNAKEVKFNGVNGISVTGNTTDGVRNVNISLNTTTLTSNANGTTTVTNGDSYVNGTTVADAINKAGWNTTLSTGKTLNVNPGDQVNYVNGNGTTANVTTTTVNGKDVVSVSYDVNTTTGTIETNGTVSVADNNAFLNASSVANLVNNAAFNVTTAKVDAFVTNQEGKANATVKAGGNITYTAGKNIAIKQDGTNFTFATEQNVTFTNANVTSTLALGNGTAGSSSPVVNLKTENATAANVNNEAPTSALNITSADGKPTQIKGVGSSLNTSTVNVTPITDAARTTEQLLDLGNTTNPLSKDVLNSAATVRDLTNLGWVVSANGNSYKDTVTNAKEVKFNGVNGISVTGNTTDGVRNVNISLNTTTLTSNANGTTTVTNGDSYVNGTTVADAINKAGWNTTLSTGKTLNVNPGDQVNYVNGNGTTANVTTTTVNGKDVVSVSYDVNTTTGTIETNGTVSVADNNAFLNASSVANLVNNAAFNVTTAKVDAFVTNQEGKANATVKAGGNITYTAGKNIAIKQDGTNFTFATEQNVTFTNANVTSTLALGNGTAGSSSPVVNLKTENATAANVNNEAPTSALNITSADGKPTQIKGVGSSLNTSTVNVTPITDAARTTEQLLDLGNTTNPLSKDVLNSAATVRDLTNLGWVVSANGNSYKDTVTNAKEVKFNGVNGISVTGNTTDGVRNVNISLNTTTLTSNANGTTTVTNGDSYVNGTTVADAINKAGWNTTLSTGKTLNVNPGDQVNYVNGNGTTANVTTTTVNGKDVVSVSYDVNTTTGTIETNGTVSVADNNAFLNASSVANLVNNAAFNVTTAKVDAFVTNQEGKANATVKAGGNITYTAGKNIAIKQDGTNFTFATEQNVTFTNANVTSTLALGNGTAGSSSPVVNLKTENATAANVNNEAPTSALNITSADGKPTQIKGVGSSLNTSTVNVTPITDAARTTEQLLDLGNTTNPLSKDVLNSAATVRDLTNLGWVVSANGNSYKDTVTNAKEVKFNGVNGISVTGNTTDGVRNVNISLNTTTLTSNANGTTTVTNGDSYVNGTTVADAINKAGWNTTLSTGKTLNVNPGDQVNYVNGNGTTANVTTTTVNGKDVVSVSYDVNTTTGTIETNGTVSVADNNAFLNASSVANLVNNAAFNVTTAKVDAFVTNQEGKANATVKAGGNITYTAGKNIAIKQDGTNFTFATEQNVTFTNANVTSTLALGNGTAGSSSPVVNLKTENATAANVNNEAPTSALNITSADGKPTQIKGVGSSLNTSTVNVTPITDAARTTEQLLDLGNTTNPLSKDVLNSAATVRDLTNLGWVVSANGNSYKDTVTNAKEVKFNGVNGISVTGNTTDGVRNVNISLNTTTLTSNANGTTTVTNGDSYVNGTTVADAINKAGWNTTLSTGKTLNVNPGDQVNYVNGNGTTANVTTTTVNGKDVVSVSYDVNTTTGTIETNGTVSVADNNAFLNASSVANLVNNAAFNVTTAKVDAFVTNQEGKANATVKAGGNITYTAGKNIAIKQDGTNFTFATEQNVTFTNANVTSTLALGNGTAGSSSPVVNLKTENATAANVNNEAPTSALNITSADGKPTQIKGVGSSLNTSTVNVTPITDAARTTEQLLDLGNTTNPLSKDVLNSAATVRDLTNLGWVVSANGNSYKDTVTNAKEVKFNGVNGISVTGNTTDGVRNVNISLNTTTLTSNANGTTTVTNGDSYVNGTTVADAINKAGWNTTLSTGKTLNVNPGDQVNYVNGNGTTANVTTTTVNGKDVVSVSYDVNTTTGTIETNGTVSVADNNAFLNASSVANLVNNAAFNVTTAKVDAFVTNQEGKANATVKAGGNITYTAGKNIAISQNGSNFTFSTTKDIEVDSVTANNRVQIGSGDTAVNLTTDLGALKVADKDGNATQITNVDAGTETMAFNKEGNRLVQVGDKYYVVDPETGEADFTTEGTPATAEELDELAKAKPALKADVAYAKAAWGLADLDNSVETNALTVADAQRLGWVVSASDNDYADSVTNANEVRFNGSNGISVTGETDEHGVRNINVSIAKGNVEGNTTTGVAAGDTNYVTGDQVAKAINESGWKTNVTNATTGATETKVVTPGTQVDYVNGNGTTANVSLKDGKVAVSYNVNQTTGSVNKDGTVSVVDGNSFLNASTVANLVNNSAFNVTTAKVDAFAENQEGKANATVKAGGNITYTAGKNIAISQNGSNFTFSTTKDIEVDSVTANNRVQIGSGDTAVNLTTDLGALKVADKDGNATQITNVDAGTETMAFNKEGNRLVQVGDKYYVVDPETGEADFTTEGTPATAEELDELAKAKPALKADVAYAKAAWGLADLDNSVETNALTVADAQRLGWVVSASDNDYADSVTNANEVRFNGSNGISVTGETDEHGVRNINVSIAKGNVEGNTTTGVATGDTNYVTGDQVANAINNSGWKTTATKVVDEAGNKIVDANKATAVNPGDSVNYVDGNSTKANVVVTKAADGKETVNVSYDLVTEDHLTPVANNAKSVTKPTNIDAKGKDAATVNDVLNAGWNLQANDEAVDAVTHGNNVNFTSKDGSVKITAKSDGSTSSLDFAVNATSIVNQVAGTISYNKDGKATTNGDGKRIATVGDVANTINNTGWLTNVTDAKGNVTTKVVTPNTQVNYVNGDGTKANVVANSTTGGLDVTFNVKSANPETLTVDGNGVKVNTGSITEATDVAGDANRGKVTVAAGEGNKVATVQNVANAINSASWTVKVADTQEEITTSTANDAGSSVRAGNEITHVAGKNLKVKRDGRNVTYALANDVSVNTVTAQNSIKVGAGNAATTVTTSSAQDGVTEVKLADAAGKATRITNVAAGVKDTDAVNVSQLRNSNAQINQNIAHLNNKVNRMGKDLRAGIAGSNAAAGLPQVYIPGKSMVAAAAGTFKGQSAVAVGYSRASDNGKVILKLQGNANTRGEVGGSVGVGYQW